MLFITASWLSGWTLVRLHISRYSVRSWPFRESSMLSPLMPLLRGNLEVTLLDEVTVLEGRAEILRALQDSVLRP